MSWGLAVTGAAADIEGLLTEAVRAHFSEQDGAGKVMLGRAKAIDGSGDEDIAAHKAEAMRHATWQVGAAIAGREQAEQAIKAAVLLVSAEHIDPVTVSLTGDANPDHAPDSDIGLSARIIIGIVRAN